MADLERGGGCRDGGLEGSGARWWLSGGGGERSVLGEGGLPGTGKGEWWWRGGGGEGGDVEGRGRDGGGRVGTVGRGKGGGGNRGVRAA